LLPTQRWWALLFVGASGFSVGDHWAKSGG
jgi:hypothetical protein